MKEILYIIGSVTAFCYIILSIDDLVWDLLCIANLPNRLEPSVPLEKLDTIPPRLLAIVVAAWHEENVIEAVIDHMIASVQYPRSMFHIFIGVYPNDLPTVEAVQKLESKYNNVHMVMNPQPGPTTKAHNLNNIIRYVKEYEENHNQRFASLTVHDAEDVVHPYEFKMTNYLLDDHDALQFPVIPLQRKPRLGNILAGMTTGTYADEFAENHYRMMPTRLATSAIVPSAGTGFVLTRKILEHYDYNSVFPEDTLTEDYKLSLILAREGFDIHYVLEKVPRLEDDNTMIWDYVATRSFFPDTFKTAVSQKTRWIYGITMESINLSEIFKDSRLTLIEKYSVCKDVKAKFSNLILIPSYLLFVYFLLSLVFDLPTIYETGSFIWYSCVLLTFLMVWRQVTRAVAIANLYGLRSMAVACLLPPLMPIRLLWGNMINITATAKAWRLRLLGPNLRTTQKQPRIAWNKTDHKFLDQHVLYRYYRRIGDVLLEKQYIDPNTLAKALEISRQEHVQVGEVLIKHNFVTEEQLMTAVANVLHTPFIGNMCAFSGKLVNEFLRDDLMNLLVYPLLKDDETYVFARTDHSRVDEMIDVLGIDCSNVHFVYSTKSLIITALSDNIPCEPPPEYQKIAEAFASKNISWEQAALALNYLYYCPDILHFMGLNVR
ncbi:MAG TPA: glycosyltransferase [Bacillota bacterium]|nr:glycosyltransferase [Bacillota bacterium]HOQ02843.1 glycosyltransferase [Bacillota bacterium]HPV13137.1 glycosyltransferase [Bacillota bacterium]